MAPRRAGDPAKLVADNSKAKEILGWHPQYTDIKQIIQTAWNLSLIHIFFFISCFICINRIIHCSTKKTNLCRKIFSTMFCCSDIS